MRHSITVVFVFGALGVLAALGPMPTPSLFWNETITPANGMHMGATIRFLQVPPDPFAGNTESVLEGTPGGESVASWGFYGTGIEIRGDGIPQSTIAIDGMVQPTSGDTVRNGDLAWAFHPLQIYFGASNNTHLRNFTFTHAMETNAYVALRIEDWADGH